MSSAPTPLALAELATALGASAPDSDLKVSGITHDHRQVRPGWMFAAIAGQKFHGARFADAAVAAGAVAVLTDVAGAESLAELPEPVVVVSDPRQAMGEAARLISADAQSVFQKVAVTGTNGKTTTTHMLAAVLAGAGKEPLLVGTVGVKFRGHMYPASRTTPEATDLHRMLAEYRQEGADSLVMEVSSHALVLHRVAGVRFEVAVFTGLSQDHLDFHEDMEDYFAAKARLFTRDLAAAAVICVDDEWGVRLAAATELPCVTYAINAPADWTCRDMTVRPDGRTRFTAVSPKGDFEVELALPGDFNIANALAALAVADRLGIDAIQAAAALASVQVPGRLERVEGGQDYTVLVDYAHTPDAVTRAVAVARSCTQGKVIAVLGCGGDRDAGKRPLMGAAAAEAADLVIVTDDNPRSEEPEAIRSAILSGAEGHQAEVREIGDRHAAIVAACAAARPGDCVIILGKGHETGQEVAGTILPFDDRLAAAEAIAASL